MEINTSNENLERFYFDLYIFDNDRIVKTINDILLCKSYCYEDYGYDYDYDFYYKNIFVNIRYRYNSSTWRSDNLQEMTIQYDKTTTNKVDFDFLINSFQFLLEKTEKYEFSIRPENIYKIDEIIQDMGVKKLIKGNFCFIDTTTDNFYNYQYRFEYKNIEVAVRISGNEDEYDPDEYEDWYDFEKNNINHNKQYIILTYAENEEKIDKNDIEFIKNKFIFL
jgi:hypothetical protein